MHATVYVLRTERCMPTAPYHESIFYYRGKMASDGDEARLDLKHGRNPLVYKSQTEGIFDVKKGAQCLTK